MEELPPAKIAIIGAGIGGSFAAKFLRENGGKNLDIRVFAKKGSEIGGRTAVCQIGDHVYETGACVIHSSNKHLVDLAKDHGEYLWFEVSPYMFCGYVPSLRSMFPPEKIPR